jgi:hypothetical protein
LHPALSIDSSTSPSPSLTIPLGAPSKFISHGSQCRRGHPCQPQFLLDRALPPLWTLGVGGRRHKEETNRGEGRAEHAVEGRQGKVSDSTRWTCGGNWSWPWSPTREIFQTRPFSPWKLVQTI